MKRAVGYVRVSTDGQVGEDKFGIRAQKKDIKEWAKAHDVEIVDWYVDEGKSGAKEDRPEFDKLIYGDEIANPPIEAVVVAKSDRIARDINIYYYYKHELLRKKLELISVADDFGSFGAFAAILESFVVVMAQMERENINKRTTGGRRVKSSIGGYSGGRSPYGYRIENHSYVIDEKEAEMVRLVFRLLDGGSSLQSVADCINNQGYLTRSGTEFTKSHIRSIRDNRQLYLGYYRYGDMESYVPGQHQPILDKQ